MILIKLDVTKLQKERFFHGKKGIFADLVLIERPNDYGDDGFVAQSISKEERDSGQRGPIVGNWRELNKKTTTTSVRPSPTSTKSPLNPQEELIPEDDDIPF